MSPSQQGASTVTVSHISVVESATEDLYSLGRGEEGHGTVNRSGSERFGSVSKTHPTSLRQLQLVERQPCLALVHSNGSTADTEKGARVIKVKRGDLTSSRRSDCMEVLELAQVPKLHCRVGGTRGKEVPILREGEAVNVCFMTFKVGHVGL